MTTHTESLIKQIHAAVCATPRPSPDNLDNLVRAAKAVVEARYYTGLEGLERLSSAIADLEGELERMKQ